MACTHPVTVVSKLFNHPEPVERLFLRVMKDMQFQKVYMPLLGPFDIGH
jgi:hypothetical protein